jgi:hypothetical protein
MKKVIIALLLFTGCNQVKQDRPKIFRLYNNTKWYYPETHTEINLPAGYYAVKDDTIICIKRDSSTILVQAKTIVNK